MRSVLLSDGPHCGAVLSIRDTTRAVDFPTPNPKWGSPWMDPDIREVYHPECPGRVITQRRNASTGEWEDVWMFLVCRYRESGTTTPEGMPIFTWEDRSR